MAKSILQNGKYCLLTLDDRTIFLDKHHVFGGANRKKSESMGLWIYVRADLHKISADSIHQDAELNKSIKKWAQRKCMEHYDMTVEDFIREFGKNYILTEGDWDVEVEGIRSY